jgi:DNA-binding response OmpR family regulator
MKKILIIEDNAILSLTLDDNLAKEGFEVVRARDGDDGLAIALSTKPDLILLDILLPKMDGLTLLNELRKDAWGKEVPVIVMSNLSTPGDIATATEGGVHAYFLKIDTRIEDVIKSIREKLAP